VQAAEVDSTYRRLLSGPTGRRFASSLRSRRISRGDELLLLRLQQLSNKLQAKIAAGAVHVSAAQVAAYYGAHVTRFRGAGKRPRPLTMAAASIRRILLEAATARAGGSAPTAGAPISCRSAAAARRSPPSRAERPRRRRAPESNTSS
jgi:hypothetical protein